MNSSGSGDLKESFLPVTGKKLSFKSPLPEEFKKALKHLAPFKREKDEEE